MNIIKNQLTFAESMQFVDGIIDSCFVKSEETGEDIDYSPASLQPLIQSSFVEFYTDYEFVDDFDKNFAEYMQVDIDNVVKNKGINKTQLDGMLKAIIDGIEFRKQKLLDSQSKQSEMYSAITNLISTLNSKAEQIDVKKLDKYFKKLNPNELLRAYQKSGIGNDLRDKTIQDLANENKELRNEVSARNVKA